MKKVTPIALLIFLFVSHLQAQNTITFQVDLTDEESVNKVGVRGGLQPLSWNENLIMTDNDSNGIYTLTVTFPDSLTGKVLEYKFLKDGIWERKDLNNRKIELTGKEQILPTDKWKIHSEDYLFNKMSRSYFGKFVFIFYSGKKQGKTPEEVVLELIEYYNWSPWPDQLKDMFDIVQYGQEGHKGGYFEILEDKPNQIKFVMGRYWRVWFDLYGDGFGMDNKGVIKGVSKDDLETYYRTWIDHFCNYNNWTYKIEDQSESRWVVTVTKGE